MGGQVGIADHLRVGDGAVLAAGSGVSQHVPPNAVFFDFPAVPYERFRERYQAVGRLKRLFQEVSRLKQQLQDLAARGDPGDPQDPPQPD
jgi:UDP-3-O-[3-hydroxymyristoyl] glucosamine N-acyltransferase